MSESGHEGIVTGLEPVDVDSNGQGNSKKLIRKTAKVKPEEVSTPTHFEHLVHIEDLQSNANNFVVPKASQDPVIKNIFSVIEKNIVCTGDGGGTAAHVPESGNKSFAAAFASVSQSSVLKLFVKNTENSSGNATAASKFFVNGTEAYDNLSNLVVPTVQMQQQRQEPVLERNNLHLKLNSATTQDEELQRQSVPSTLAPDYVEQGISRRSSGAESTVILPRRKLGYVPSTESIDDASLTPMTPLMPTVLPPNQNTDLKRQEAAYDALVSRNVNSKKPMSPVYENQEVIAEVGMEKDSETKTIGFNDGTGSSAEIQQALKQLDDVLDEQIPIEVFGTLSPKPIRMPPKIPCAKNLERKNEPSVVSEGSKSSVKQLTEMLSSKPLHFGVNGVPPKFRATDRNQESAKEQEGNTETELSASVSASESEASSDAPPQKLKSSLIGVSIFGPNTEKSIAEIIAEKRSRKGMLRPPPPPISPKPVLRIPKGTAPKSDLEEHDQKPSSSQVVSLLDLPEKPAQTIFDSRRNASKVKAARDEKSEISEEKQERPKHEVSSVVTKFSTVSSQSNSVAPKTADANSEISSSNSATGQQILNWNMYQISRSVPATKPGSLTSGNYENLYPEDGAKPVLETSFDGPVATTTSGTVLKPVGNGTAIRSKEKLWIEEKGNKNAELASTSRSVTCEQDVVNSPREQHHQKQQSVGAEKPFVVPSASPSEGSDFVSDVKWRTGYVAPVDPDEFVDNDPQSGPIPPLRRRSKHGSYGRRVSGVQQRPRIVQRSTSMYTSCGSDHLSSFAVGGIRESKDDASDGDYHRAVQRWSSVSTPETPEQIQNEQPKTAVPLIPPKPAPRRIDYLKQPPTMPSNKVADISEAGNKDMVGKTSKRPVPIPRQTKIKAALNEDLLKKTSFTGTKTAHGTINGLEPMITIAKTTDDVDDGNEWTLRL